MFDWSTFASQLAQVLAAFALALPIAWEREHADRSAGLRTFPLVAAASCVYVVLGVAIGGGTSGDVEARIVQGLMTGIGFIGGGAILKQESAVRGTATAASIWMTGALGAAVGFKRWELALIVCLMTVLTLRVGTMLRRHLSLAERADAQDPK